MHRPSRTTLVLFLAAHAAMPQTTSAGVFDKIIITSEGQLRSMRGFSRDNGSARRRANQAALQRAAAAAQSKRSQEIWDASVKQMESNATPPPLQRAAALNAIDQVTSLLAGKLTVHDKDASNGWTALHYASYFGSSDVVRLLIARGANVNLGTGTGRFTPLLFSVMKGEYESSLVLIANGADVNRADFDGNTPLHVAALNLDAEQVTLLLGSGAFARSTNAAKEFPADWAESAYQKATQGTTSTQNQYATCQRCDGSGKRSPEEMRRLTSASLSNMTSGVQKISNKCPDCNGTGRVVTQSQTTETPAPISDQQRADLDRRHAQIIAALSAYSTAKPTDGDRTQRAALVKAAKAQRLFEDARGFLSGTKVQAQAASGQSASVPATAPFVNGPAALRALEEASGLGLADASYLLGLMFQEGQGIPAEPQQALIWFRKAADQGSAVARTTLALALRDGKGTAPDVKQAVALLEQSAAQDDPEANYQLAVGARDGVGMAVDKAKAINLFRRAAAAGHDLAADALAVLAPKPAGPAAILGGWQVEPGWSFTLSQQDERFTLTEQWAGKVKTSSDCKVFGDRVAFRWDRDVFVVGPAEGGVEVCQYHRQATAVFDRNDALPDHADVTRTALSTGGEATAAAPSTAAPAPSNDRPAAGRRRLTIRATEGSNSTAVSLGRLVAGQGVTFQYVSGEWTAYPAQGAASPDDVPVKHWNVLPVRLCDKRPDGSLVELAVIPGGTKQKPFVFKPATDVNELVLNMNDQRPSNNVGQVVYDVRVDDAPNR